MLILSLVMSSPLYFMAEIKIVITFKESVQMESEHITTCVEFWTRGWRIAYKTCSCVFQFLGPVILVVSLKDVFFFQINFFHFVQPRKYIHSCSIYLVLMTIFPNFCKKKSRIAYKRSNRKYKKYKEYIFKELNELCMQFL